ncbi:NF-kappa-B essential modulator isoform X2 [Haliaeetus albicilla]|uniref:NF-kappa-B essential modulator isoform X2 n=1 Tax=Haliaeetus albicilla TaxID=8969 RepID=UPI0037E94FAB
MSGGRWRRPAEMVQPGGGGGAGPGSGNGADGGTAGEEAAAAAGGGRVLLELGSPEGLQRLLAENRELKEALRRSSEALRGRCEELRRLQALRRGERELLRGRAGQARALVERLRAERDEAARRLRHQHPPASPNGPQEEAATLPENPPTSLSPPCSQDEDGPGDPEPPRGDPMSPPDPSPTEQLRQRLAAAETELAAAREAGAAAEERAQEAARQAELQLQALRRQLEQDKASVKAQVTSLLGELRESQSRLESSRRERDELERRAQAAGERCRALEEAAGGHALQLDQLRLQVQNLEAALRVERQGATEEKRKLVQLQVAYHHLFQEYDAHIKASLEGDKRSQGTWRQLGEARAQLQQAEEALAAKQELIDKLKAEAEQHRATLETIPVLQAQADIYKADFEAERAAREELHAQREALQEALAQLQLRVDAEGAARIRMEEMRNRHSELRPPTAGGGAGFGGLPAPLCAPPEEQPVLCCPKCQYKAPDMDTLQIHVMDCIK